MKQEHINEIKAIVVLALGMILLASLVSFVPEDLSWYTSSPNIPPKDLIKVIGAYTAGTLFFVFGYSAYFLVSFLFFWSWNKFSSREIGFSIAKLFSFIILLSVISSLFGISGTQDATARFTRAGFIGFLTSDFLLNYLGKTGSYIVLLTLGALALILTGEFLITPLIMRCVEGAQNI